MKRLSCYNSLEYPYNLLTDLYGTLSESFVLPTDFKENFNRFLERLTSVEKDYLYLRYEKYMTYTAIAELKHVTVSSPYNTILRIYRKLSDDECRITLLEGSNAYEIYSAERKYIISHFPEEMSITEAGFTLKCRNRLKFNGLGTVKDILNLDDCEFWELDSMSYNMLDGVLKVLSRHGLNVSKFELKNPKRVRTLNLKYPDNLLIGIFKRMPANWKKPDDIEKNLSFALGTLTLREQYFIYEYYREGLAYTKIAVNNSLTPEGVRFIITGALRKLRSPFNGKIILYGFDNKGEYCANPSDVLLSETTANPILVKRLRAERIITVADLFSCELDKLYTVNGITNDSLMHIVDAISDYGVSVKCFTDKMRLYYKCVGGYSNGKT